MRRSTPQLKPTRIGALDFLEKPITLQKLLSAVESGLQRNRAPNPAAIANGMYTRPYPQANPAAAAAAANANAPARPVQAAPVASSPASGNLNVQTYHPQGVEHGYGNPNLPHSRPGFVAAFDLPLDIPLREARDAFERVYFEHHLTREHGSMTRVAEKDRA